MKTVGKAFWVIVWVFAIAGVWVLFNRPDLLIVGASALEPAPAFDHSNCQYPERWTNPPNGCDNSDPAVPECIKASYSEQSEKACIDAFVKEHNPDSSTNNATQPALNTPLTPATPEAVRCGK